MNSIAVDSSGNAYLLGSRGGSNAFPTTTGAYQTTPGPAFITKINPSLRGSTSLIYSTFLLSPFSTAACCSVDSAGGIAVDANGNAFLAGSASLDLTLVNAVMGSSNGIMQSIDAGQSWVVPGSEGLWALPALQQELASGFQGFRALALDTSTSPRTLYAGTQLGNILKSTDGGLNWNLSFTIPGTPLFCDDISGPGLLNALAVDPTHPSNVYAATCVSGVHKSSDGGKTWSLFNTGLSGRALYNVNALQFDGGTLYAGAGNGLYILTPGATSWTSTTLGHPVLSIAIDPTTSPHTIYTTPQYGVADNSSWRSTDGGATWTSIGDDYGTSFSALGVDTSTSPSTVYAYAQNALSGAVSRSTDGGNTWTQLNFCCQGEPGGQEPSAVIVDSATRPSTVYLQDSENGVWKSVDGGNTWITVLATSIHAIALDSTNATATTPAILYAGTDYPTHNLFVAELNPSGSTLLFSTYLGGVATDSLGSTIALDATGNVYLAGTVRNFFPTNGPSAFSFPAVNAYQPSAGRATGGSAIFAKLGSQTLPMSSSGSVSSQVGVQTGTLTVTFPDITGSSTSSAPIVTVTPLSSATTANFSLSDNLGAYDISTTALYSAAVTLCFQAMTVNDLTTFNNLQLFHIVDGAAVNVTSSHDFSTRTVCGSVTSLSPFVLFNPSTSTTLSSTLNPLIFGQPVTFTATITSSGPSTGTVTFNDGSTVVASVPLASGQASFSTSSLAAGSHSITATFSGDSRWNGSASSVLSQTVNKAATSTAISTSTSPSILNQSVTFIATVTVSAPGLGTPTGGVTFKDGSTTLGTRTLSSAKAVFTTSSLTIGPHSVTAVYGGDSNFSGSTSASSIQQVQYEPAGTTCLGSPGHQILQPINSDGTSVWKQGRTVPAQFRACDVNGMSVGTAGVVSKFSLTKIISGTMTAVDETVSSTSADTAFRWDATNQQWIFNISTTSLAANNTYVYTITLNDGTSIPFQFGLR